ncbi:MAG: hypothetical protein LUF30_07040 [Lachnospiraceae bacterium]|nr:hypothetical protein [Lachnospiraceae bacterium]
MKNVERTETQRNENVFVRRIFDKDTGKSLIFRYHEGEDPEQTFGLNWWSTSSIPYDEVMRQEAVTALRTEQRNAIHAQQLLESGDGAREKAERLEVLGEQARRLFKELQEIEEPDLEWYQRKEQGEISETEYREKRSGIDDDFSRREPAFSEVMEQAMQLNKVFDRRNPWIRLYTGIEIPEVLTKEQARKWVGRLTVKDMTTVELSVPKEYAFWKEQLPESWMEGI